MKSSSLIKSISWCISVSLAWQGLLGQTAQADRLFEDRTVGKMLAESETSRGDVEWRNQMHVKMNSSPLPEFTRYEPTLMSGLAAFAQQPITGRITLRGDLFGGALYAEESEDSDGPSTSVSSHFFAYGFDPQLSIQTANEIEVFGGVELRGQSDYEEVRNNAELQSTTTRGGTFLWRPQFGLMKKSSNWHAGAHYALSDESTVSLTTETSEGAFTTEDFVGLPSRIGGFFESSLGGSLQFGIELDLIQGGSLSLTAGDQAVYADSIRAHVHLVFLYSGLSSLWVGLSHETHGYENQNFVTFDSIPVTEFECTYTASSGLYFGLQLAYSNDTQSTDEINTIFELYGVALRTGLKFSK